MSEPVDPDDFHVVVVDPNEQHRQDVAGILENDFRFNVNTCAQLSNPPDHTIALLVEASLLRDGLEQYEAYRRLPLILFNAEELNDDERQTIEESCEDVYFLHATAKQEKRRVQRIIKKHSRSRGFLLTRGKIGERLVKRSLQTELTLGDDRKATGETTGVNFGGLGARLTGLETLVLRQEHEGEECRVDFQEEDLPDKPAYGTILQVRPSFNSEHEAFVTVEFDPDCPFLNSDQARDVLNKLIRRQHDSSALRSGRDFRTSRSTD